MRKINKIIVILIAITFIFHGLNSILSMQGLVPKLGFLSEVLLTLIAIHVVISLILFIRSFKSFKNGNLYPSISIGFIIKRVTGVIIFVTMIIHMVYAINDIHNRTPFDIYKYSNFILLILSLFLHLAVSIKPMLISFGVKHFNLVSYIIIAILGIIMLYMLFASTMAFIASL